MRKLADFQLMKQEVEKKAEKKFKIKNIKNLIKAYSKSKKGDSFIIDNLVEDCNLTKEDAEKYLTMYNEGEL